MLRLQARPFQRSRRGNSLIDVMLGVFVMAMTVIGSLALFRTSHMQSARSSQLTRAATLCRRKLDQLRTINPATSSIGSLVSAGMLDSETPIPGVGYLFTTSDRVAQELPGGNGLMTISGLGTDLVTVTVTVRWTGNGNMQQEVTATSYISEKSPWVQP